MRESFKSSFLSLRVLVLAALIFLSLMSWAQPRVVFIGDSLTDGYGVSRKKAFPALVEEEIRQKWPEIQVFNAGVSGALSSQAEAFVRRALRLEPDLIVLALGANDGLQGRSPERMKKNLSRALALAKKKDIKVLLAGMKMYTSHGEDYRERFEGVFKSLVTEFSVVFMPFLLEGVAAVPEMNLSDGRHPNEKGHQMIAQNILPFIDQFLVELEREGGE